jgi:hypothetical protein
MVVVLVAADRMAMKMMVVTDKVVAQVVRVVVLQEDEVEEVAELAESAVVDKDAEAEVANSNKANEPPIIMPAVAVAQVVVSIITVIRTTTIIISVAAEVHRKLLSKMGHKRRQVVVVEAVKPIVVVEAVKPMVEIRQRSTATAAATTRRVQVVVETTRDVRLQFHQKATEPYDGVTSTPTTPCKAFWLHVILDSYH